METFSEIRALHADSGYAEFGYDREEAARFNRSVLRLSMVVGIAVFVLISGIVIIEAPATIPVFLVLGVTMNVYFKISREAKESAQQ